MSDGYENTRHDNAIRDHTVNPLENRKVYIKTLGCKVNTFDSRVLENQFRAKGYEIIGSPEHADIQIINSCSVTANAEREARYLLRRFQRENPKSVRVITGCYAQIHSSQLQDLAEVDYVVPNEVKHDLIALLEGKLHNASSAKLPAEVKAVSKNRQSQFKSSVVVFDEAISDQTRAYLKVQDGCDGFCAYCQIPYARGASRSVPPQQVLTEVRRLIQHGVPELVVTGIHVGDYGRDLSQAEDNSPFVELLQSIFAEKGLRQLRISSLEPSEVNEPLLKMLKDHEVQFCDHFHLPLQSGSDRILKLMRRSYTTTQYAETVSMIRSYFPKIHISGDVIVGFPQEGEEEFAQTQDFIQSLHFGSLHVFPYSKRPNTLAEKLPGHMAPEIIKLRVRILRELSTQLYRTYAAQFLDQTLSVLWENQTDTQGRLLGKTKNYLNICAPRNADTQAGSISSVCIRGFVDEKTLLAT